MDILGTVPGRVCRPVGMLCSLEALQGAMAMAMLWACHLAREGVVHVLFRLTRKPSEPRATAVRDAQGAGRVVAGMGN